MEQLKKLLPGLLFTAALAWLSMQIQQLEWMERLHFSSLIIAIIIGMIINNVVKLPASLGEGIRFSSKKLLRLAIILLGFKLSFAQVADIGGRGLILVTIVTTVTMVFAVWVGKRFGLDEGLALLIGAGTSICGASAVAAVAPVVKAEEKDTTFAIATVTLFGTLAMFIYPLLYRVFDLPDVFYALWTGSSIHEVAQVVAAGFAAGEEAGQFATVVKLTRVLLLIPMTVLLGYLQNRKAGKTEGAGQKVAIPWFVFGFLAMVIVNSLGIVPAPWVKTLVKIDGFLLTWAMAGLGLVTSLDKMRKVGLKPFYAGFVTWLFIAVFGFVVAWLLFI